MTEVVLQENVDFVIKHPSSIVAYVRIPIRLLCAELGYAYGVAKSRVTHGVTS